MTARSEIIALLDTISALGQRNFGDKAPEGAAFPYTVTKVLLPGRSPALTGEGRVFYWRDLVQIDLWDRSATEDLTLLDEICDVLDGTKIVSGLRLHVRGANRLDDPDFTLAHTAITLAYAKPR